MGSFWANSGVEKNEFVKLGLLFLFLFALNNNLLACYGDKINHSAGADIYHAANDAKIENTERAIENTNKDISVLRERIDTILKTVDFFNISLSFLALFIAIAGVGVSIYVAITSRKIENTFLKVREYHKSLFELEKRANEVEKAINNKLYLGILKEENKYIFRRLMIVPEDIANYYSKLTSRPLEERHFYDFLEIYKKHFLGKPPDEYSRSLISLTFQHFPYNAYYENDVYNDFIRDLKVSIYAYFECEIVKITEEITKALVDAGIKTDKEKALPFYQKVLLTKHPKEKIYDVVSKSLQTRQNLLDFIEIINGIDALKALKEYLVNFFIKTYSSVDMKPHEKELLGIKE